ncbi:Hpt domain-containing protein [Melittangium boletus]|uniref:Hpt domain-containing protein n=1 Tax=Melittangium boletus TaxID=83453 RepID=UPI003DA23F25
MRDDAPALDLEHLCRLRELGDTNASAALARMFHRYLDSIPPQLSRIREAVAAGDAGRLAREAHDLAGSSAVYGLPRLRQCCLALEAHAKASARDGGEALVARVERAFEEARPLVLAELPLEG